jgi:hypothetical protein
MTTTYKVVLSNLKEPDTWSELADHLGISNDVFARHFRYGDYADIEIELDADLRVVGGRVLPIGRVDED